SELGHYVHELFGIDLIGYWLLCVLAIAVHSVVNQKYLGHFVMILYFVALAFSGPLGFEHNLYKYANEIAVTYSDMNGYGHFMRRLRTFEAYYAAWAMLLAIAAYLLWTRGTITGWRERLNVAQRRVTPRGGGAPGGVAAARRPRGG